MPSDLPDLPPAEEDRLRQKFLLQWAAALLVLGAVVLLVLPLGQIPRPVRVLTALTDLIMAAVIGVLLRQAFPRP